MERRESRIVDLLYRARHRLIPAKLDLLLPA